MHMPQCAGESQFTPSAVLGPGTELRSRAQWQAPLPGMPPYWSSSQLFNSVLAFSISIAINTPGWVFFIVFCCYFMDTESPHTTQENSKKFLEV